MKSYKILQSGFTLAETMVAVGIFSIVILVGTGAILNANRTHQKVQTQRAIIDNISFSLEDISRNLRTGYSYHCGSSTNGDVAQDCSSCYPMIAFKNAKSTADKEIIDWYTLYEPGGEYNGYALGKASNAGTSLFFSKLEPITPPEVELDPEESGFVVIGAASGDGLQPRVLITLSGTVKDLESSTSFFIQTSVSQRVPDR